MDFGMASRLKRIIKPDGRTLMLAVDHGYFMGPTMGLENIRKTIDPLLPYCDVIMAARGAFRNYIDPSTDKPFVLRVSGGTSILSRELLREGIVCSIKDAIRLNASGLAFSVMVGSDFERDTLLGLSKFVDWGEEYGIPVLAVTAVGKEMERDARYISLACRIAAELGAHMVKTYYCQDFEKVIETCPVPVVIAGGKKLPEKEALEMAYSAIKAGASGVDMGRNIFQSEDPVAMVQAVRGVVHDGKNAEDAYKLFEKLKDKKGN